MAITNADGSIVLTTKVDTTGLKKDLFSMKSGVSSLTASLGKSSVVMAAAFGIKELINFSKKTAAQATSVEASIQRLIDIYGEASQVVGNFIDENAHALGMSKAAATSFSAVYGNLFNVWADQATNAELTNRYLQMTAVIASKTGRTVKDVQERIRSGLLGNTEAIEDLGVFVNVKTIEMTDAFQRMANGKSWEQLDAYTQQQIRSMAILEQATAKYGDEVANTSATARNRFKAAYEDFQATWGKVVNRVLIPALNVLTEMLNTSTAIMQDIFEISGETISGNIDGATESQKQFNGELEETNKLLKKSLAGFDDIQILASSKSEEGQGTSGLFDLNLESSEIPKTEKNITKFSNKISKIIKPLKKAFIELGDTIKKTFKPIYEDVIEPLRNWFVDDFLKENVNNITAGVKNLTDIFTLFGDKIQDIWQNKFQRVFAGIGGLITTIIDKLTESFNYFSEQLKENEVEIEAIIGAIATVATFIWDTIYPAIKATIDNIGPTLKTTLNFIFSVIKAVGGFLSFMENIFKGFKALLQGNIEDASEYFKKAAQGIVSFWEGAINGVVSLINLFLTNVARHLDIFVGSFRGLISGIGNIIGQDWNLNWNIVAPKIPAMKIPALAQGTVVPPNKRFIAELGDNTREHEIVSPLSTIEQAVENVLGRQGGATREEHYYLNESELMRIVYKLFEGGKRLKGASLEEGGY